MTFAAPLFLLAALAALIPLLLHMIHRQRAPELPFSTLRFLQISVQRTRRRKYLHDVLLLLLRMAALLLIALALAGPTIRFAGGWLIGRRTAAVVLVVDNSASMDVRDQRGARWNAALEAARSVLGRLETGDEVALIAACGPQASDFGRLHQNQEVVRQALETVKPSYERADLGAALRAAESLLDQSAVANREIYVLTDGQRSSWDNITPAAPAKKQPATVVVCDVHRDGLPNVSLQRVTLQTVGPVVGTPCRAEVELRGDPAVRQQRFLELYLRGEKSAVSPTLIVEPGTTVKYTFDFRLETAGLYEGEIRLGGEDAGARDDRLYFALQLGRQVPVTLVKPNETSPGHLDDAYYLERALLPTREGRWGVRLTTIPSSRLGLLTPEAQAVVYCVNLPALDATAARRLADYVAQGGQVVWICGPNVSGPAYNAMNNAAGGQLLPCRLGDIRGISAEHPQGWTIGSMDADHPALAPFATPPSLYRSVLVYQHLAVTDVDPNVRVLARLDDGAPLLLERRVGNGSVCLLATAAHTSWSTLPLRPLFLPLTARLTFYLARSQAVPTELVAGSPLVLPPLLGKGEYLEVQVPAGATTRLTGGADGADQATRFTDTYDVGVYRIEHRRAASRETTAAVVNHDPLESSFEPVRAEDWPGLLSGRTLLLARDPAELQSALDRLRQGRQLWPFFLLAVLAALLGEAYFANRFAEPAG